jgi:hypothetical protein
MKKFGPKTCLTASTWDGTAYIYDAKGGPVKSPGAGKWPVQPIYIMKNIGP